MQSAGFRRCLQVAKTFNLYIEYNVTLCDLHWYSVDFYTMSAFEILKDQHALSLELRQNQH